ncbi:MAG: hypothetical protein KGO49_12125 [Gammaproteobacteria bacterium]|nr:hypothetical protein [Gammaproteobacteria bacterium]
MKYKILLYITIQFMIYSYAFATQSTVENYIECYSRNFCHIDSTSISIANKTGKILYTEYDVSNSDMVGIQLSFLPNNHNGKPIIIGKFPQDGSYYPVIEAVSTYMSLKGNTKFIVIATLRDLYEKSNPDFLGISYEIYIADVIQLQDGNIQFKEDKKSLNGIRNGQVGKWDDGTTEKFKFTTIRAIKDELRRDGL